MAKKKRAKPTRKTLSVTQMASGLYDLKTGKKKPADEVKRILNTRKSFDKHRKAKRDATSALPKIDVDEHINGAAWIIAVSADDSLVDDLISDLDTWREELEAVVAEHGTGLTFGQLSGSMIDDERKYLKKKK